MQSQFNFFEVAITILGVEVTIDVTLKSKSVLAFSNILATKSYEKPVTTISF
jgi:hypothetical protein